MKYGSIIMIQRPKKSPCIGNTRCSVLPRNFVCNNLPEKSWQQFFWDSEGILLLEFMSHKTAITGDTYASKMVALREIIKQKCRGNLSAGVLLLHDNAPARKSRTSRAAIRKCGFVELNYPPYSQDLAPSNYFLFRNLIKFLRARRFPDDNAVKDTVTGYFDTQDVSLFLRVFHHCILVN